MYLLARISLVVDRSEPTFTLVQTKNLLADKFSTVLGCSVLSKTLLLFSKPGNTFNYGFINILNNLRNLENATKMCFVKIGSICLSVENVLSA